MHHPGMMLVIFLTLGTCFAADKKTGFRRVKKSEKASPKIILKGETDHELNPQQSPTVKLLCHY